MNHRHFAGLAALALAAALSAPSLAQDEAPKNPAMPPMAGMGCFKAMQEACPGMKPGSDEFKACVKANPAALAGCGAPAGGSTGAKRGMGASPCAEDLQKYCPGMFPGEADFDACAKKNESKMSSACREWHDQHKSEIEANKAKYKNDPCVKETKRLCPGLSPMSKEFSACIGTHMDELSPECKGKGKGKGSGKGPSKANSECVAAMTKLCGSDAAPGSPEFIKCAMEHHADMPASCRKKKS